MSSIAVHDDMTGDDLVYACVGVRERVCVGWMGGLAYVQLRGWWRRVRRQRLDGSVQRERGRVCDGDGRTVSGWIGGWRRRAGIDPCWASIIASGCLPCHA
jgi:hypothetical protein